MTTKVRIRGRRGPRRNVWHVRVNGKDWQYDKTLIYGKHLSVVFRREEAPVRSVDDADNPPGEIPILPVVV